jgi:hypothetical protein
MRYAAFIHPDRPRLIYGGGRWRPAEAQLGRRQPLSVASWLIQIEGILPVRRETPAGSPCGSRD